MFSLGVFQKKKSPNFIEEELHVSDHIILLFFCAACMLHVMFHKFKSFSSFLLDVPLTNIQTE